MGQRPCPTQCSCARQRCQPDAAPLACRPRDASRHSTRTPPRTHLGGAHLMGHKDAGPCDSTQHTVPDGLISTPRGSELLQIVCTSYFSQQWLTRTPACQCRLVSFRWPLTPVPATSARSPAHYAVTPQSFERGQRRDLRSPAAAHRRAAACDGPHPVPAKKRFVLSQPYAYSVLVFGVSWRSCGRRLQQPRSGCHEPDGDRGGEKEAR